jgi:hypothetical protein
MGQLIADLFIALDGYASGEGAPAYYGYPGPELERWVNDHLATPQVLLMGRVAYEALLASAQNHPAEGPDRMSELPKVVLIQDAARALGLGQQAGGQGGPS